MSEPNASPSRAVIDIAVVDDNVFLRDFLGSPQSLSPHQRVVARASDAAELVEMLPNIPDRRCDVILLDLKVVTEDAPDPAVQRATAALVAVQGVRAVEMLLEATAQATAGGWLERVPAILIYTQESAPRVQVHCLLAGAAGVVHKREPMDRLREAIDVVATGGLVINDRMAGMIELLASRKNMDLTDTEAAVLALSAHGRTRREIAKDLGSSENTVDKHLGAIRTKFGHEGPMTDLADAFGLRDMAPPTPGGAAARRHGLRTLLQRLDRSRRDS
jgi:DNA-binding NarL/FixJ family response regulator